MTIGTSNSDHFHDTEGSDDVSGHQGRLHSDNDGFQTTDRLTVTDAPADDTLSYTNLVTHNNYTVNVDGTNYAFTVTYTLTSGVMAWELNSGTIDAEDLVTAFNQHVLLTVSDFSDKLHETWSFTLGNAQAWDKHEDGTTHYYRFSKMMEGQSGGNNKNNDGINFIPAFKNARAETYFGTWLSSNRYKPSRK